MISLVRILLQVWRESWWYRRFPVINQLFKFAIIGVTSFLLDLGVYAALTRTSDFWRYYFIAANTVSFMVSVVWSFTWNKIWTFKSGRSGSTRRQYIKFLTVSLGGLVLSSILLYLAVKSWHIYDILAKFLIAIVVMFWNFNLNKFWTFRRARTSDIVDDNDEMIVGGI